MTRRRPIIRVLSSASAVDHDSNRTIGCAAEEAEHSQLSGSDMLTRAAVMSILAREARETGRPLSSCWKIAEKMVGACGKRARA